MIRRGARRNRSAQRAAQNADPRRKREEELRREQARLSKCSDRLIHAYQEGLVTLLQLRQRMPPLRKQAQAVGSELQSLEMAASDQTKYLQLAETLATFRSKLQARAETLNISDRQQILRLLVREILVGVQTITIRHSLPVPPSAGSNSISSPSSCSAGGSPTPSYLLRSGSLHAPMRRGKRSKLQHPHAEAA